MAHPPPELDPGLLDRLRRGFPLRMDAGGRLWFEGDALEHPRVVAYFRAHLDVTPNDEPIVFVDGKYVHLTCDDAPFRVTHLRRDQGTFILTLDDGRELPLDPSTLMDEGDAGISAHVPSRQSGRPMAARFTNHAAVSLGQFVESSDAGTWLTLGDERFLIHAISDSSPT